MIYLSYDCVAMVSDASFSNDGGRLSSPAQPTHDVVLTLFRRYPDVG